MSSFSGKKPRIFISHSSKDNTFGNRIVRDLREALRNDDAVWYDTQGGLNGGDVWWREIVQELEQRDIFILIISPEAMDSEWIRREFLIAQTTKKQIIPILHRKCEMWIDLKIIQTIDFLSPITYQSSFDDLIKVIGVPPRRAKKPPSPQGTLLFMYDIHRSGLSSVAWAPDGTRIASGGGDDGIIHIWDAYTGETLYTYRGHINGVLPQVWRVLWSPDSTAIVSSGNRAEVQVWNPLNGQKIAAYKGHSHVAPTIASLAWSPDGQKIASTNINMGLDKAVHIWNARTGQGITKIEMHPLFLRLNASSLGGVAWSPDSTHIACGLTGGMGIFNAQTRAQLHSYKTDSKSVYFYLGYSPDGTRLASASALHAQVWNITTGTLLLSYIDHRKAIRQIAWSPDGKYIATASEDTTVHIWDPDTGTRIYTYTGHNKIVASVTWSPDSTRIASACRDGIIHVWQAI
ncbi:MAG TPA: TIR domain-containing protein [Ktedonobacteraceae bacterium]